MEITIQILTGIVYTAASQPLRMEGDQKVWHGVSKRGRSDSYRKKNKAKMNLERKRRGRLLAVNQLSCTQKCACCSERSCT